MTTVKTEVRRIARWIIKLELKARGVKVSTVKASAISAAAKLLLANKVVADDITRFAKRRVR
jgi:hypothetical protein